MSSSTLCKIEGCNNETKSPDGICRICAYKIEKGLIEKILKKEPAKAPKRSESMPIAEKICIGTEKEECGKPFAPTSNRQARCNKCREQHKKEYQTSARKKTKGPKAKKSVVEKKNTVKASAVAKVNTPTNGNLVEMLQVDYKSTLDRARCLFVTLQTIKDATGQQFNIPELRVGEE